MLDLTQDSEHHSDPLATFGTTRYESERRSVLGGQLHGYAGDGNDSASSRGASSPVSSEEFLAANMNDILTLGPTSTDGARIANDLTMYR
jgi:hypothetical protein